MLQLKDATYDTTGEYICEVTVPSLPALHTHGSVHIIVQGPSSFPLNFKITAVKRVFIILMCVCVCVRAGAPQMVGVEQEVQLEEAAGRMVNLSCEVRGHPRPTISWNIVGSQVDHFIFLHISEDIQLLLDTFLAGQQKSYAGVCPQSWQEVVNKASDHMTQSVASVLVGSDISALCNASNEMGSEVKVFSVRASKSGFLCCRVPAVHER